MGHADASQIQALEIGSPDTVRTAPFYTNLSVQVLIAMVLAIALGYLSPAKAIAMKPLAMVSFA